MHLVAPSIFSSRQVFINNFIPLTVGYEVATTFANFNQDRAWDSPSLVPPSSVYHFRSKTTLACLALSSSCLPSRKVRTTLSSSPLLRPAPRTSRNILTPSLTLYSSSHSIVTNSVSPSQLPRCRLPQWKPPLWASHFPSWTCFTPTSGIYSSSTRSSRQQSQLWSIGATSPPPSSTTRYGVTPTTPRTSINDQRVPDMCLPPVIKNGDDDTSSRGHPPVARWDNATLLNLSGTCRLLNNLVADVLYKNIVLSECPGDIDRKHLMFLLRTLVERPDFRHRVKHLTIVPSIDTWDCSFGGSGKSPLSLMGKGASREELELASTFLRVSAIRKLDEQAQTILNTAGLELAQGRYPSNHKIKRSTPWYERALAALVCFCPYIRSLRFWGPVPSCGWRESRSVAFDMDGFERIIRNVREHATTAQGSMFQFLEAVSVLSSRQKLHSYEAFSVWSSPTLTGFQALGFLSMKDWHRLPVFDCSSTLTHLDIGHLYPQRFHGRWTNLDRPSTARALAASDFRKMLSTFTNLKFLRVSHALFTRHIGVEIMKFGDLLTELLPTSIEHFEVAVFNHGQDAWVEDWNIDSSVMAFFKGLGLWNSDLQEEGYRGKFGIAYPHLRKFGIMVHNKGNNVDLAEFWKDRRRINYERLWEWLFYGENFLRWHDSYYQWAHEYGLPEDFGEQEELSDDGLPDNEVKDEDEQDVSADAIEDGYRQRGTLEALHGHMEEMGVSFQVSTFQAQASYDGPDNVIYDEGKVIQLLPWIPKGNLKAIYGG